MDTHLIRMSKFLSLVLRHKPEEIGLALDEQGWADVDDLIGRANRHGVALTRELVERIVATNEKKRFALSADGAKIRANQGHSVEVDLGLEARQPPEVLFHGTATRFLPGIAEKGLLPGGRQHVHLSPDEPTAVTVGRRHGKPVVLRVRCGEMHRAGFAFYCAANGVWLTERVPLAFLDFPPLAERQ
ncbi:MAG TPA: RNA 2'-phosphotransferase [Gemmataceae bacterium]|jgi:putative RNA 2'-phosphotransferase|nr:RNA 2'-phosphotransferase [Gemmataceae bacterium]